MIRHHIIAGRVILEIDGGDIAVRQVMTLDEARLVRMGLDNAIWAVGAGVADHETLADLIAQVGPPA